jgi:putative transposase
MTAMQSLSDAPLTATPAGATMPRFQDGTINMQELLRQLAESVVNEIMGAEADQMCGEGNSRNGYRERRLPACVGTLTPGVPKLRRGSFFPEDVLTRYQRVDRALVAAVAEACATGTSTRKVQRVARKMGIDGLSKDQAGAIARDLDADVEELLSRELSGVRVPYLWLDATYARCRREGRVASTAVVTAIGCDEHGRRRVLGVSVVDTESYDSWLSFPDAVKQRGVSGVRLVTSDAHEGLRRAIQEVFQGAAWQRCVARPVRDCAREAGSRQLGRRVYGIVAPIFRAKDADQAGAMYHLACEMLGECCPKAARVLEEAEPDALAYLDLPQSHWKRTRTNNVQERTNREIKRRSRVVQVFPSEASLTRLVGAVLCEQDEEWPGSRYFSEEKISELYEDRPKPEPPTEERSEELRLVAEQAIKASLELADRMEAA